MKRFGCLFTILLLLTFFCGCSISKPNDYNAIDMSYEHICELNDFKCYVSYLGETTTITGETAKELYKILIDSTSGIERVDSSSQSESIYLVFYNSAYDYPSADKITEFYGCYLVYSDGLLKFSISPYHSSSFDYPLETNIFNSILAKIYP